MLVTGQAGTGKSTKLRAVAALLPKRDVGLFNNALQTDRDAVEALLTFEQFELDDDGEETDTLVAQGVGVEISKLLDRLTDDIDGVVQTKLNTLSLSQMNIYR